ncbi:hypothetical protein Dimus_025369 [Dionaea muscipula]
MSSGSRTLFPKLALVVVGDVGVIGPGFIPPNFEASMSTAMAKERSKFVQIDEIWKNRVQFQQSADWFNHEVSLANGHQQDLVGFSIHYKVQRREWGYGG